MNREQLDRIAGGVGFIAALDQSGGSTPAALEAYGIGREAYPTDRDMFDLVHEMRTRIVTSPVFGGDRILGAIVFENTMDRQIDDRPSAGYLADVKHIVPFLKVDAGLASEAQGVRTLRPMPGLDALLVRATEHGIFGTKMRSVIRHADPAGVASVVSQQFDLAERISAAGLVPIVEPEVDIHSSTKARAEELLLSAIVARLDGLDPDELVMLKLTLPESEDLYAELVGHPNVLRVCALSGGYSQAEAVSRLGRNYGVIASFSRALTEGLSVQQDESTFDRTLDASIAAILGASRT